MTHSHERADDLERRALEQRRRNDAAKRDQGQRREQIASRQRAAEQQQARWREEEELQLRRLGEQFARWAQKRGLAVGRRRLFSRSEPEWTIATETVHTDMGDSRSMPPPPRTYSVAITAGGELRHHRPKGYNEVHFTYAQIEGGVVALMARLMPDPG